MTCCGLLASAMASPFSLACSKPSVSKSPSQSGSRSRHCSWFPHSDSGSLPARPPSPWLSAWEYPRTDSVYPLVPDPRVSHSSFYLALNLLGTFCAGLAMGAGFLSLILPGSDPPYWTDPDYLRSFPILGSNCMHPLPFSVMGSFPFLR